MNDPARDPEASEPGETPAPQPEFQLYRAKVKAHSQGGGGFAFTKQAALLVVVVLFFGAYLALNHTWTTPPPRPALPEVVELLALGQSVEEVKALGDRCKKHGMRWVGAYGPEGSGEWNFEGFEPSFPDNVITEPLRLRGELSFEDDALVKARVIDDALPGPEVNALDVVDGFLDGFMGALQSGKPPTLADAVARFGPGKRVGRVLEAEAEHPELIVYRWSYAFLGAKGRNGLVNLDLYATPEGLVLGATNPSGVVLRLAAK